MALKFSCPFDGVDARVSTEQGWRERDLNRLWRIWALKAVVLDAWIADNRGPWHDRFRNGYILEFQIFYCCLYSKTDQSNQCLP